MSTLALYQELIPDHASVSTTLIQAKLDLAIKVHTTRVVLGDPYDEMMVYYAAHCVQTTPGAVPGAAGNAGTVGPVTSLKARELQISYGSIGGGASNESGDDAWLRTTTYGNMYLDIRNRRSVTAPTVASLPIVAGFQWLT